MDIQPVSGWLEDSHELIMSRMFSWVILLIYAQLMMKWEERELLSVSI